MKQKNNFVKKKLKNILLKEKSIVSLIYQTKKLYSGLITEDVLNNLKK